MQQLLSPLRRHFVEETHTHTQSRNENKMGISYHLKIIGFFFALYLNNFAGVLCQQSRGDFLISFLIEIGKLSNYLFIHQSRMW